MARYNIIDPETGKPRLNAEQCETCILKPTSPLRRGPGKLNPRRLKEIFSDQSGIVCHSTFPDSAAEGVEPALCRGAADSLPSQMIRIYERLGGFIEVPAPPCTWHKPASSDGDTAREARERRGRLAERDHEEVMHGGNPCDCEKGGSDA